MFTSERNEDMWTLPQARNVMLRLTTVRVGGVAVEEGTQIGIESKEIVKKRRRMEFINNLNIVHLWAGTSAEAESMGPANHRFRLVCGCCRTETIVFEIRTSNSFS